MGKTPPSAGQLTTLLWGLQREDTCLLTDSGVNVTKSEGTGLITLIISHICKPRDPE